MAKRTAWIVTWSHHASKPNGNFPEIPQGQPLALFPGRTSVDRIEGAMVALHQMIEGSYPSSGIMHVQRKSANVVNWDAPKNFATIGHDPQIVAYKTSDLEHLTGDAFIRQVTGEGQLSWTSPKPVSWNEFRESLRRQGEAD